MSLPGFGIGITIASRQEGGNSPDCHTSLKISNKTEREVKGKCLRNLAKEEMGHVKQFCSRLLHMRQQATVSGKGLNRFRYSYLVTYEC